MKSLKNWFKTIGIKRSIVIIIVLLIFISMAGLGLTKYSDTLQDTALIKVGKLEVPTKLFMTEYNIILQQNAAQLSQNPYATENILRSMISRYVSTLIFVNEADHLNIGASDDLIYQIIASTPYFKDKDGKFNKNMYTKAVTQIYGSEDAYTKILKNDLKQNQLTGSIVNGLYQPKLINKYALQSLNQARNVDYIVFDRKNATNLPKPADKDLQTLLDSNKGIYTDPEYRSLQLFSINIADYLQTAKVSDQEITNYYNKNKNKYMSQETRDFSQVVTDDENEANKLYAELKDKKSLNNKQASVTSLTSVSKATLPPSMVDSIFNAPLNVVQAPVKTELGYQIILVTKINQPQALPLIKVKKQIENELKGNKMSELYENLKTQLDAAIKSNTSLEQLHKQFNSDLITVNNVNQYGFDSNNKFISKEMQNKDVLDAAFALPLNHTSETIISQNYFYVVKVNKINPSHVQSFAEAKPQLIMQWNYTKASEAIQKQAEQAVSTYTKQGNFNKLPFKVKSITLSREKTQKDNPFNNYAMDQIFLSKLNTPVQGVLDDQNIYVAVVKKINNNTTSKLSDKDLTQINQYLNNMYQQDILTELFNSLNKRYSVKVNQKVLANTLGNGASASANN
ncbi:peptidyl-prolyl cis-trans isomerase [Rickettsiales bacterium LUAb2]